jgi:hypothetical protein
MCRELDDVITVESILEGYWGEEARRDMLEYIDGIGRTAAVKTTVSDLNWFRSDGSTADKG